MAVRIGIDVGATKTKIIMITGKGEIVARSKIKTDSDKKPEPIVERAAAAVESLLKAQKVRPSSVEAVAVGICGFQNIRTGMIDISPNLHWHQVPFKKLMEKRVGRTVYVANDVNAAAWGEFVYGAGRGARDMVAIFVGSGIGGGIIANGRLVEGGTGTAGEVGHMTFRVNGLKCDCGRKGCFEAYGGGMPMERRMRRAIKRGSSERVLKMAGGDAGKINTRVIRQAAKRGDKTARKIWGEAEESLSTLCANLVSLLNPDRLVIGGGVLAGNPGLLKTIRQGVGERAVPLSGRHVKVVRSKLGDDAVAMGAAALVDLHRAG
jgi:glucokinase